MNLLKTHRITAAAFAAIALLALSSCDLGTPIKASPTEVEGLTGTLVGPNGAPVSGAWVKVYPASGATAKTSAWAAI
ncbi:MAG TPA: hypothetical protein VHO02_02255, partial [Fibrobacteria bacterium]|nr:hypothetical protein [Fibrobacteria bacterium]